MKEENTQRRVVVLKVKPGKLERWREWCRTLEGERRKEALETLVEEGVTEEGCAEFVLGNEMYVVAYTEGQMLTANMEREINRLHKEMKQECLEYVCEASSLYRLLR